MDFLNKIIEFTFAWMLIIELRIVSYLRIRLRVSQDIRLTPVKVNMICL